MKLYNYLEGLEVLQTNVSRFDMEISGVTSRTNEIAEGYIFVCISGMHLDGHTLALSARDKGACLLIVERVAEDVLLSGLPFIRVENTRAALSLMCAKAYGNPERVLDITAVTGTNGKTSTCRLLSGIYGQAGIKVKTLGTLDGGLTTRDPEDLFKSLKEAFDLGASSVVMEASSHALYLDKLYGIRFKNAVFTNLTPEHLDFHKTMNGYALAKAKLFKNSNYGLYNLDDGYWEKVSSLAEGKRYTYSLADKRADFYAEDLVFSGSKGFSYTLVGPGDCRLRIVSSLCGGFNVYNTIAAAAMAYIGGIPDRAIEDGIRSVTYIEGRLERVEVGDIPFDVYIDYAHTPDALEKLLECIRSIREPKQRIILLFGCGGDRDSTKRPEMGRIASRLADFVVVTADNSRSEKTSDIIREIMKGIDKERPHKVIENRAEAIEYAISNASEGDIILLAGKGHERYEIDSFGKKRFNEKEIAANAVYKRFKGK